jgi:hypothetical protein
VLDAVADARRVPDKQWVEEFVDELTRTQEIVDVESWSDEHRLIIHGKYAVSGKRFSYEMPIILAPRRQTEFAQCRSAARRGSGRTGRVYFS